MSGNMCKLRHKMRNNKNLTHESPNFTNCFFLSNFLYYLGLFFRSLRPHYQKKKFEIFFFTNCVMPKRVSLVKSLHGQIKLELFFSSSIHFCRFWYWWFHPDTLRDSMSCMQVFVFYCCFYLHMFRESESPVQIFLYACINGCWIQVC